MLTEIVLNPSVIIPTYCLGTGWRKRPPADAAASDLTFSKQRARSALAVSSFQSAYEFSLLGLDVSSPQF